MPDGQTSLLAKLIIIGAAIGLGRLMVSRDRITARLLIGRMIMGSAVAPVAAIPLFKF
ncbi:TPA: holin, partial [Escherichia coli]